MDDSLEIATLKSDNLGRILLMRRPDGELFIRRDLDKVSHWLRLPARWLVHREARALRKAQSLDFVPKLLGSSARGLDRSHFGGRAMHLRPPRGDTGYFREAGRQLRALHRLGVTHNDLAKEANWIVLENGRPALIDFQLAIVGRPRSRWMRLLAREDLRHLLKHKRTYCPSALTPAERRLLNRPSWVRRLWFRTGKPIYRFVTRRLLKWEDNEGRGPRA